MPQYQIYAWGDGSTIAPFDVSSNILAKLIEANSLSSEFEIIPNSNIFKSNSGCLPILIPNDGDLQIEGFIEIWKFMNSKVSNDLVVLKPKDKIIHDSYLNELIKIFEIITSYNFFVVKRNYEGFTRSLFPSLLPWPTQYNPPIDLRNMALEMCLNEGIIDDESVSTDHQMLTTDLEDELKLLKNEEKNLRDTPVINDMQKSQIDKQLDIINQKKSIIANMQCIKKLKSILQYFHEYSLNNSIFKIILLTYLKCNMINKLPENFIDVWLEKEYPDIHSELRTFNVDFKFNAGNASKISLSNAMASYISSIF